MVRGKNLVGTVPKQGSVRTPKPSVPVAFLMAELGACSFAIDAASLVYCCGLHWRYSALLTL